MNKVLRKVAIAAVVAAAAVGIGTAVTSPAHADTGWGYAIQIHL